MVGGVPVTVRLAVLLTMPAVGVWVVVTPEVVLGWTPTVLLVTVKVTVQLLFAGRVIPKKLREVAPPENDEGLAPQVPPTLVLGAMLMLTRLSVNVALDRATELLLETVRVTVEVPPGVIDVGLNALVIVGEAVVVTVRLAVLLTAPAVGVWVVVTPEVVLGWTPAVLLVTVKVTVQLLFAASVNPKKLREVVPPANDAGPAPQVPPTLVFAAMLMLTRWLRECGAGQIDRVAIGQREGHQRGKASSDRCRTERLGDCRGGRSGYSQIGGVADRAGGRRLSGGHA